MRLNEKEFGSRKELASYLKKTDALALVIINDSSLGALKVVKKEAIAMLENLAELDGDQITKGDGENGTISTNYEGDVCFFPYTT